MDGDIVESVNDMRIAIEESFQSDYGWGDKTNVVDVIRQLAKAITPSVPGNKDAAGCHVESLTESVMGMTAALVQIANAIERVADVMASPPPSENS